MKNYRYKERRNRLVRRVVFWIAEILLAVALAYGMITYVFQVITVHGESMEPAYHNQAVVLVNKFIYRIQSPKRLDPVALEISTGSATHYTVKRVSGLPGEKILIEDGKLKVDGKELEGVFSEEVISPGTAAYTVELGEDEYFVMGDNCNNSEDSRAANIGNIKREQFIGKVGMKLRDGH